MKQMGKLMLGILIVFCVIIGGSVAFADDSNDVFISGIHNCSQLDSQSSEKLDSVNDDSGVMQYKEVFQTISDNEAKQLEILETTSNNIEDQNLKDYITIQKDRVTALKQVCDRMIELCSNSEQQNTTYSNLKNSDETLKNALNTYNTKEQETKKFLDNHTDVKDKLSQINDLCGDFVGNTSSE